MVKCQYFTVTFKFSPNRLELDAINYHQSFAARSSPHLYSVSFVGSSNTIALGSKQHVQLMQRSFVVHTYTNPSRIFDINNCTYCLPPQAAADQKSLGEAN